MAGTISSAGTWTALQTDLTPYRDIAKPPPFRNININGADFNPIPDEVIQFLKLAQVNWAVAQFGTGTFLDFWSTVLLLQKMLHAYTMARGVERAGQVFTDGQTQTG